MRNWKKNSLNICSYGFLLACFGTTVFANPEQNLRQGVELLNECLHLGNGPISDEVSLEIRRLLNLVVNDLNATGEQRTEATGGLRRLLRARLLKSKVSVDVESVRKDSHKRQAESPTESSEAQLSARATPSKGDEFLASPVQPAKKSRVDALQAQLDKATSLRHSFGKPANIDLARRILLLVAEPSNGGTRSQISQALLGLAKTYGREGDIGNEFHYLGQSLLNNPHCLRTLLFRAKASYVLGDRTSAQKDVQTILHLNDSDLDDEDKVHLPYYKVQAQELLDQNQTPAATPYPALKDPSLRWQRS